MYFIASIVDFCRYINDNIENHVIVSYKINYNKG